MIKNMVHAVLYGTIGRERRTKKRFRITRAIRVLFSDVLTYMFNFPGGWGRQLTIIICAFGA